MALKAQDQNGLASLKDLDPTENLIRPYEGRLEVQKDSVLLGDINGDKVKDSAFILYKRVLSPENTYVKECGQNVCYCRIKFNSNITEIIIEGYSVWVKPTFDVNGDQKNEILIFRELEQYNWGVLSLYSFYNNKWKLLSNVNVFLVDDTAYENRIVKLKSKYYIVADVWNKDYSLIHRKKVLIHK
ncbi:MAG: hypothetical protein ABI426_09275 [Flavobacterium sp.]